ncbi:hypothetical protein QJS82_06810 [Psychrobacter maritimus]|jgi:hypothetical protein|uniref:hypothetical protein n=1 Tax=Psychrobacter maritimus TaxID=256325 RepID=UPI00248CD9AE|nr:hypothetical protein [Psychrobacter sp. WB2]WGV11937.1 hypothetical protein QJS82_06810 [Psychrobacter sp. WB2]
MKKLLLMSAISLSMVGCATPSYNYTPTTKEINKPPVGIITTASLGDHMLTQGIMVQQEAIYISSPMKLGGYSLTNGYFAKQGDDLKYEHYKMVGGIDGGNITKGLLSDPPMSLAIRKEDNSLCVMTIYNIIASCNQAPFERKNWETANKNSFQQTLIYNGKVGNKINIGYREFSSDTARPAFNNDVEYDLSESKQIGYKGALIDVLEANNQEIKYKVIRSFK